MLGVQLIFLVISNAIFYYRHKKVQKFGFLCEKRKLKTLQAWTPSSGSSLEKDCNNKKNESAIRMYQIYKEY